MKDLHTFVDYLKSKGLTPFEIQYTCSIREHGLTMTKAIYDFDRKYSDQEIDGFPDSAIEILEVHYGEKRLKKITNATSLSRE